MKSAARRRSAVLCLCALILAPGAFAGPTPDADALLRQAYENYRSESSQTDVVMTIHRPQWERRLEMRAWTRGEDDALVRFTAPARDAGAATLKLGRDTWEFNPRLNQVIKLPASMLGQSWMGSDFSYDDLAKSTSILTDYTHRLAGERREGGHAVWTVQATPRPGAPVVWGRIDIEIRDDFVLLGETFLDQDLKPARRMRTERVGLLGVRPYPVTMTMSPADQPGRWTRVESSAGRFNAGLPAWIFTLSNLQNPRP